MECKRKPPFSVQSVTTQDHNKFKNTNRLKGLTVKGKI